MKAAALMIGLILPCGAAAQDRDFTLSAPTELAETGFLQHLLPRFSLKHGVRITHVEDNPTVAFGLVEGVAVFEGLGKIWHLSPSEAPGPQLFIAWLKSDIGKRTIEGYKPDGAPVFTTEITVEVATPAMALEGDPVVGEALSLKHCGRCHVINYSNRMKGMGQTPSFGLLRTFEDWKNRFSSFYVLNPHPSFSQVAGITPPFSARLPPAITPVEITQDDLQAILAYVATIPPADLGAPLQDQ